MRLPPNRHLDLLALVGSPEPLAGLLATLQRMGFGVDLARELRAAQSTFFQSGGHELLVLAPDVAPGLARQVLDSLRQVDPDLAVITYGSALSRNLLPLGVTSLTLHPSSRAGLGAFLSVVRKLPERT